MKEIETWRCRVACAPMRKEQSDKSEMINQALFGETLEILEDLGNWARVKLQFDGYEGFMEKRLLIQTNKDEKYFYHILSHQTVELPEGTLTLPFGAQSKYGSEAILGLDWSINQFLGTPYLWGGKSTFGTDCSGFVQTAFRVLGINLPRDAYQQVDFGKTVHFANEALPGDLAFFSNKEGKIIHVGICIENQEIVHSAGWVKIDLLDQQGIFNRETQHYSHQLATIKRLM
jgi:cell wall-associated NlpC family hydrolase